MKKGGPFRIPPLEFVRDWTLGLGRVVHIVGTHHRARILPLGAHVTINQFDHSPSAKHPKRDSRP